MPTYEYRARDTQESCDNCRDSFEVRQAMSDRPLDKCPECGSPVERLISRCSVRTSPSEKSMLSDKNLKEKGFRKLVNEGDGRFRRTV
ncbi:MAG: zinc ribbon domain-containing protein [Planctomycetes bacterium]|nr:zinc ribbon domain-containing protein [Planctomycetota bacterium]